MNETLRYTDALQLRDTTSFLPYFELLFAELQKVAEADSIELEIKARALCDYIGDFWTTEARKKLQEQGSFGRNAEGIEQPARCMTIESETETTICKWGYEIGSNGEKMKRITIFSIPYKSERNSHGLLESDHQYDIELTQGDVSVLRRDWEPTPGRSPWKTTSISVSFDVDNQNQIAAHSSV